MDQFTVSMVSYKFRQFRVKKLSILYIIFNNTFHLTGIDFVKIKDPEAAAKFNIIHTPALVYFRKKTPLVYDGEYFFLI